MSRPNVVPPPVGPLLNPSPCPTHLHLLLSLTPPVPSIVLHASHIIMRSFVLSSIHEYHTSDGKRWQACPVMQYRPDRHFDAEAIILNRLGFYHTTETFILNRKTQTPRWFPSPTTSKSPTPKTLHPVLSLPPPSRPGGGGAGLEDVD